MVGGNFEAGLERAAFLAMSFVALLGDWGELSEISAEDDLQASEGLLFAPSQCAGKIIQKMQDLGRDLQTLALRPRRQ